MPASDQPGSGRAAASAGRVLRPAVLLALAGVLATPAFGQYTQPGTGPVNVTPKLDPGAGAAQPKPVNVTKRPSAEAGGGETVVAGEHGPSYLVTGFTIRYAQETPGLPMVEALGKVMVELGKVEDGYVAPREGVPTVRLRIAEAADRGAERYYTSAIREVSKAIYDELSRQGFVGVVVSPSDEDIYMPNDANDPAWGKDLRPAGKTDLGLMVSVGRVNEVRTVASGDRVSDDARINNPLHERIVRNSPVKPSSEGDLIRTDLMRRDLVDDYVGRLNRHPGRHVQIALGQGQDPGTMALDYLVSEAKPWFVYGQVSNTGTEQTNEWRTQLGFEHNQLTGNDDILRLYYTTAGFDESHSFNGEYEAPIFSSDRYRWKVYGDWGTYTASEVGFASEEFQGDNWSMGAELIANVFQRGDLFVDVFGGARWSNIKVDNKLVDVQGQTDFFLPYVGAKVERTTDLMGSYGSIRFEGNAPSIAGTDRDQLDNLGRLQTDETWLTFQWALSNSMYIEPFVAGEAFRSGQSTLAHEVYASFRGQYAFDYRLVPNFEQVAGGMYSVRGYPESIVAGDTVVIGTAEYRFHLPRALAVQPDPAQTPLFGEPFRVSPQVPYGRADWDLVLKAFIDVGWTANSDPLSYERDRTLAGTGIGLDFQYRRNVTLRLDWGFALKDVPGEVEQGDNRLHFSATILY